MRILLVEDDPMIGQELTRALRDGGFTVDWLRDGLQAMAAVAEDSWACVLLDLGLPRRDGLDVLKAARRAGRADPVLVLTARDGVEDRVRALDLGADDYVVKPVDMRELLARLRAVVRRRDGSASSTIGTDELQLDLKSREAVWRGTRHELSAREFALLHALLASPGAILSRAQLEQRIYGWGEEVMSNAVDAVIYGMRRKLGPDVIRNVRGLGWRVAGARR